MVNGEFCNFEQGPIRPPSEASSLLIRVTRNCPWNRCTFCPVYKESKFSVRSVDSVKADIDAVLRYFNNLKEIVDKTGNLIHRDLIKTKKKVTSSSEMYAFNAALNWYSSGANSIFLQDANSIIVKPRDLIDILRYLKKAFPWVKRITSYGRSHTIARINEFDLHEIYSAGLNRIHVGLESGSDKVLNMVQKGCDSKAHIKAGLAVKAAGIQLSEYVMPGLGGITLLREHALETAAVINQINPDFIRLRTLYVPKASELYNLCKSGKFEKGSALDIAKEIRLFINNLQGITSVIVSDHMLNLFEEVNGSLPDDKGIMLEIIDRFLEFSKENQCFFQVGRRMGVFRFVSDMDKLEKLDQVSEFCQNNNITPDNVDSMLSKVMGSFI